MALGKKKAGERREPTFGLCRIAVRPAPQPAGSGERGRRRQAEKAQARGQIRRRRRASRAANRAKGGLRRLVSRSVYWTAVAGIWAVLAVVGVLVWVGAHLPPIQSLEIPKRPPTITIVGADGSAARGARRDGRHQRLAEGPAALSAEGLHRHRGPALLSAFRRRPARHRPRRGRQRAASRRVAGRLDADPAARQEPVPDAGPHHRRASCRRSSWRCGSSASTPRTEILELYLNRVYFGAGAYGVEAAAQKLFRQVGQGGDAGRGGDARRPRQVAVAAGAEPQSRGRREARPARARRDGGGRLHHRQAGAASRSPIRSTPSSRPAPARVNYVADWITEVLDDLVGADRPVDRGRDLDRSEAAVGSRSRDHRRARGQERQVQGVARARWWR